MDDSGEGVPLCYPCRAEDHDACENRRTPTGPAFTLASAIYGPNVTECCCGVPSGRDATPTKEDDRA